MSTEQQINVIVCKVMEIQIIFECCNYVLNRYVSNTSRVEYLERIKQIEIRFQSSLYFCTFEFSFQENVVF